ncbi:MAG TPA: cytochrome c peroxidase [Chitinophagales bacterium]|nr:cytochrome c peroxidase [Chitinophagales bacterium]
MNKLSHTVLLFTPKQIVAILFIAFFISSGFFVSKESGPDELDFQLDSLLQQNGFDGLIENQLEVKLGRKLNHAKVNLGRLVFFDPGLGLHQDNSCSGCHSPTAGLGDSQPIAIGIQNNDTVGAHRIGPRNQRRTPSVINTAFYPNLMWNGRFASLTGDPFNNSQGFEFPSPEDSIFKNGSEYLNQISHLLVAQAHIPFTELPEMAGFTTSEEDGVVSFGCSEIDFSIFNDGEGLTVPGNDPDINSANFRIRDKVLEILNGNADYRKLFGKIYPEVKHGGDITFIMVGEVVAEFEFSLTFAKAPLDKYAMGNKHALTDAEKRGAIIFFTKGKCITCHAVSGNSNQMFSDFEMHNAGVPQVHPVFGAGTGDVPFSDTTCPKSVTGTLDVGREEFTGDIADRYKFRSSPLRNLKSQAAYFHNGSFKILEEALSFHLNPAVNIKTYTPSQCGVPQDLEYNSADMADVMKTLDPVLEDGINLSEDEKADLLAFLTEGLYDKRAADEELKKLIPEHVPSGVKLPYFEFDELGAEKNSVATLSNDPPFTFQLYPNPVESKLHIETSGPGRITKVEVIDATGEILIVQVVNSSLRETSVPIEKLQPGMYFIRITNKENATIVKKIIKI